ncbi:hypothetical protein CTI12_AA146360 [Artemisia annua]|uniref:Uncharacterized protein n=1 Tax=Artemisia annua TaxID=35608 RepID=A0A2U1NJ84_ARTAN|nr:hypothetical protein CTI12_AA146360 [Artemisia annua]
MSDCQTSCGLLGHTEKECLTKPNEIDGKTFKEWPFQEYLRASNSRDDGPFGGISVPVNSASNYRHHNRTPTGDHHEEFPNWEGVAHGRCFNGEENGGNMVSSSGNFPQSATSGLEITKLKEPIMEHNTSISKDSAQSESIIKCNESEYGPGLNNVGRAGENNSVGAQGRQDKIEKECLTKPNEIDGKTFKEWPFQEYLRASNSRDDGPFGGISVPEGVAHGRCFNGEENGGNMVSSSGNFPQSATVVPVDFEQLSNVEILRPGLNNVGRAGENNSVGAQGRQDKIGQEMFTYKVPNSNWQSEVTIAIKNKVWKRRDRKGDIMDIDNVKKLKDSCDSNLTEHSLTIIFLMETRIHDSETRGFRYIFPHYNVLVINFVGRTGGLLLFWKKDCDLAVENFSRNHIDFLVKEDGGNVWRGTGIYGWPTQQEKFRTWALLRSLQSYQRRPWVCFGDFNEVLYAYEKAGRRGCNINQMTAFLEACNFCNLEDMSATGVKFTWSNGRRGAANVRKRLDRFLTAVDWLDLFPGASFHNLARIASDHSPILCRLLPLVKKTPVFRFESMWLRDESIHEVVQDAWANALGSGLQNDPCAIVEECAARLSEWNKYSCGHVQRLLKSKQRSLQILQGSFDASTSAEQKELREEIKELLTREEKIWKQRSRIQWLSEGDKNTRFFHSRASNRRKRNRILRLKDEDGRWVENDDDVCILVTCYFTNLFCSSSPQDCKSVVYDIDRSLTHNDRIALEIHVTSTEVYEALMRMDPTKAPGPDVREVAHQTKYLGLPAIIVKDLVHMGSKWNIGDGRNVNVWEDFWLADYKRLGPKPHNTEVSYVRDLLDSEEEDVVHVLFKCSKAKDVWDRCSFGKLYDTPGASTMHDFCRLILDTSPTCWDFFMIILWGLWTRRNKHFHAQLDRREADVEVMAKQILLDYSNANKKVVSRGIGLTQTTSVSVWKKPQVDMIKFNCDAAWQKESGKVGLGFVARNCNGDVLISGAKSEAYANSPIEAEAKAIWWATIHARNRGYSNVVFESDSLSLINALRNRSVPLEIVSMFADILSKSGDFNICEWSFVRREGNMVAHSIASWALGCTSNVILEGEVPTCAVVLATEDVVSSEC